MNRQLVRSALLAFVVSRLIVFAFLIVGSQLAFLGKVYSNSVWETRVDLQRERFLPELERVAMVGDSWWYRSIAIDGYDRPSTGEPVATDTRSATGEQAPNWAFFPLYPLLVRLLSLTESFALNGLIVSNVALLCALLLVGVVATGFGLEVEDAQRAIYYLAFFPTSYFLSLPLTESVFLALSLASVLAGQRGRWLLAGLLGGLAALTRFPGILLVAPLGIMFYERKDRPFARALSIGLVPVGTLVFAAHLNDLTGDPLAFAHVQTKWQRSAAWAWQPVAGYLSKPDLVGEPWNLIALNFVIALLLLGAGVVWCVRREWALGIYTLLSVLLPLSTGTLQSLSRYAVVVFPLFLLLAIAGRRASVDRVILALSATLLGWLVALLTLRVDFALA